MAVASPCLQEDWDTWRKEMEEDRRSRWRERKGVRHSEQWAELGMTEGEEEEEVEEGEEKEDVKEKERGWKQYVDDWLGEQKREPKDEGRNEDEEAQQKQQQQRQQQQESAGRRHEKVREGENTSGGFDDTGDLETVEDGQWEVEVPLVVEPDYRETRSEGNGLSGAQTTREIQESQEELEEQREESTDQEETESETWSDEKIISGALIDEEVNRKRGEEVEEEELTDQKEIDAESWRDESSVPGVLAAQEEITGRQQVETELTGCEEIDAERWCDENGVPGEQAIKVEENQERWEELQGEEEGLTDDEEVDAEPSLEEEDKECDEDDLVRVYSSRDSYPTEVFHTLKEFRDSSLLTDLTLSTEDGKSFQVHSPVLAAVSSLVRHRLQEKDGKMERSRERRGVYIETEDQGWSMLLGPEVDHVGLMGVLEFAYTGAIAALNRDTLAQIQAAAHTLGVTRVLDLCTEGEERMKGGGGQKKEERKISAAEQMKVSLQSIRELWMERVGCDVVLGAVGASLCAHRVVLAASSDYFRGMFISGMRESQQPSVTLPFLLASELEALIGCSYSGALPLSWACVFEITGTSLQLQFKTALSLCLNFLQQEINPQSCLDVVSFARAYEMVQLLEVADDFVLRQFQKVARTSKFKDLPAKQLLKYLKSHSLCVPSELVVFQAVVGWIQAKPKRRLRFAKELMKTIKFPLMTFKEFKEVQVMKMWSDHGMAEVYRTISEDFCSNDKTPQNQCRIYLPKESMVLVGGDQISDDFSRRSITRELWFGNSLRNHIGIVKAMDWRSLGEMPEPPRFSHEVAVIRGQLYVIGGRQYYGVDDHLNSACRYDPLQNSWERLADMQEKRCSFSMVVLDGMLYAIGGHSNPDNLESVERYCPSTDVWSFVHPLNMALCGHVAKVVHGQIFISGGLNNTYQCLVSMFLYHPERGSTSLANMTKPRVHHCMEALGDHLYVAGGITTDDNMAAIDQLSCEVYNLATDSWTAFTSLPVPHVGAGSVVLEGKFYVLGGYSQEDYSETKIVHRYDSTTQRWENMGKMPGPNNDIRVCLLCLPPHLRL